MPFTKGNSGNPFRPKGSLNPLQKDRELYQLLDTNKIKEMNWSW